MSEPEPENLVKEKIYRSIYRYACQKYHEYSNSCRAAKQAICNYRRRKRDQYAHRDYVHRTIAVLTLIFVMAYTVITFIALQESDSNARRQHQDTMDTQYRADLNAI